MTTMNSPSVAGVHFRPSRPIARLRYLIAMVAVFAIGVPVHGAIVFNDTFEDIGGTSTKGDDAGDPNDLAWYSALNFGVASVQSDAFAGGGSTKALQLSSTDTFRRLGALFPSTTLGSNVGDKLTLTFDMRLSEAPTSNATGFRLGLYNGNGTSISSDNPNGTSQPTQQNDDFGYYVRFTTGPAGSVSGEIVKEGAGDNPLGGTIGGTAFSSPAGTAVGINDQTLHNFSLELTRASATSVSFSLSYDGVVKATGTDAATPTVTFDTIYFGQGNISTDLRIDNINLQSVAVPEPSTIILVSLGLVGLLIARRRMT